MMQFHETELGKRFFQGQLPELISALTDIAAALKTPALAYQLQQSVPEDFLRDLYLGNYDPSDISATSQEKEVMPEVIAIQEQLRERLYQGEWDLFERYCSLQSAIGTIDREQAFAAGFRSATTLIAAGLSAPAQKTEAEHGQPV